MGSQTQDSSNNITLCLFISQVFSCLSLSLSLCVLFAPVLVLLFPSPVVPVNVFLQLIMSRKWQSIVIKEDGPVADQAANQLHRLGALPGLCWGHTRPSLSTIIGTKDCCNEYKMWTCSWDWSRQGSGYHRESGFRQALTIWLLLVCSKMCAFFFSLFLVQQTKAWNIVEMSYFYFVLRMRKEKRSLWK